MTYGSLPKGLPTRKISEKFINSNKIQKREHNNKIEQMDMDGHQNLAVILLLIDVLRDKPLSML